MQTLQFSAPVRIWDRSDVVELRDVQQAQAFLDQWPARRRGPVYRCAVNGCAAAIAGQLTAEEARRAVASFAQITGILAKEAPHPAGISEAIRPKLPG